MVNTGESERALQIRTFISDIPKVMQEKVTLEKQDADGKMIQVEEGHVLKFARWFAIPKGQKSKLFVRQCYEALFKKVDDAWNNPTQFHVLLVGTPGTSKTFFLNYVAFKLLSESRTFNVIICYDGWVVSVDPTGTIKTGQDLRDFEFLLQSLETVVLYDCSKTNSNPPHTAKAKVLAASSFNPDQYKDFTKMFCTTLCMPLWSLDELELCRQVCFDKELLQNQISQTSTVEDNEDPLYNVSAAELENKYNMWGGVIRWTIGSQCTASEIDFRKAVTGLNLDAVFKAVGSWNQMDFKDLTITHRLIHADTQDMESFQYKFCSQAACEAAIQQLAVDTESKCRQFLAGTSGQSIYASLRGQVFEAYAHRILAKKEIIPVRFLDGDGTERDNINIGKRSLKVFEKLEDIQKSYYAVPKIRNFAAVDSLAAPYLAFSMTVSSDHPTVASGLLNILPAVQDRPILVFVVPQEIEATFKEQKYWTRDKKIMTRVPEEIKRIRQAVTAVEF
jgi:hypothetical protein